MDKDRRNTVIATAVVGGAGCVAAAAPFVLSFAPSERAQAAGAPVLYDVSQVPLGEMRTVEWRGKPVWVLHRTPAMIDALKKDEDRLADPLSKRNAYPTPEYALKDPDMRSIKPEYLIVVGICTHLGCSPGGPYPAGAVAPLGDDPGFLCPCHGSTFDLAGRVFKNKPAPDNLEVPPHKYVSATQVLIGDDSKAG
ncbi:MAG TPA: ubiquinol-cytochrome c reductase iron-sulfur subunit [Rhizomicrobium sp.]|nr:ubiquinol-cytochrome c reductase iron-sulfur subunit [Rhizomicrobium sp.]